MVRLHGRPRGISLLELLIGTTLMGLVLYAIATVYSQATRGMTKATQRYETKTALLQVASTLQKFIATGDSRFFGFSGRGPADRTLARLIVPLPGRCADLSRAGCDGDVGLLFTHYDKSASPAVSVICALAPTTFLVDLRNPTYGIATFDTTGFKVDDATGVNAIGRVPAATDTLLALFNPPRATIWRAVAPPMKLNVAVNPDGSFTPPLPQECVARLQPGLPPDQAVDRLYTLQVAPYVLTAFTGGATVSPGEMTDTQGAFPQRLFAARLRTIGRMPETAGVGKLAIEECHAPGGALVCDHEINHVPSVKRLRLDAGFKLALGDQVTVQTYEILGNGQPQSSACAAPTCLALRIPDAAALSVALPLAGSVESYTQLTPDAFSLIKTEVASRIKFRTLFQEDMSGSRRNPAQAEIEEGFDVVFP